MSGRPSATTSAGDNEERCALIPTSPAPADGIMSRPLAPRLNQSGGKGTGPSAAGQPAAPVPALDPIHRQKIMQLRLQAAKAAQKKPGFRSKFLTNPCSTSGKILFNLSHVIAT